MMNQIRNPKSEARPALIAECSADGAIFDDRRFRDYSS
jgi:hypothetical protein